ncbi:hypothetical protein GIB67_034005 [Kingdonia uniflora]|uniref:Myb-like domain-containing protein n=1 Tax=Kingdonia uniflora TaxID=39325 RepID=A0A7J7M612_9MAGN|nr:hypothetical protein GIB67_034005 [Kingdonia uniflora]
MEKEVRMITCGDEDDERVSEWEAGLPSLNDLTPLSQALIPPELASAFSITAEPFRSMGDVNRASQSTLLSIRRQNSGVSASNMKSLNSFMEDRSGDPLILEGGDQEFDHEHVLGDGDDPRELTQEGSEKRKLENVGEEADSGSQALKKPRLVWTPQLHKRFVEVVHHLDIKNAVPKTIMQLMNVEGLTRENVASHLQKYRLYLKRMQGLSNEGPSASDQLFASTPVPQSLRDSGANGNMPPPQLMQYGAGLPMIPMQYGFEFHAYNNMMREQQRDWSGNKYGSVVPFSHGSSDK